MYKEDGMKKRGFVLLIIGLVLLSTAFLFLREEKTDTRTYSGSLIVRPGSMNYTRISVRQDSDLTYRLTYNTTIEPGTLEVYIAPGGNPYEEIFILQNKSNGVVSQFGSPGDYLLAFVNHGSGTISVTYKLDVSYRYIAEKYGSITSITAALLILLSLIVIYNDVVSYYSEKYPDVRRAPGIECHSIKLNKHVCTIQTMILDKEEAASIIRKYYEEKGYKHRKTLSMGLIMEKQRINPLGKDKPALVTIDFYDLPIISLTYSIPHSRASGSIDLAWIFEEAKGLMEKLIVGEKDKT